MSEATYALTVTNLRSGFSDVDATIEGGSVRATVKRMEADLASDDGTFSIRVPLPAVGTDALAAQLADWAIGATVMMTLSAQAPETFKAEPKAVLSRDARLAGAAPAEAVSE